MGVRTDDALILETLRLMYAGRIVEDERAVDEYSLSVARQAGRGPRRLAYLAFGRQHVLRSRSRARLLRRLDLALGELEHKVPAGLFQIDGAAAIVKGDRAAIVPESVINRSTAVEQTAASLAAGIVERPALFVDPLNSQIVVHPGLAGVIDLPMLSHDHLAAVGRYELAALFWSDHEVDEDERRSISTIRLFSRLAHGDDIENQHALSCAEALSRFSIIAGLQPRDSAMSEVFATLG